MDDRIGFLEALAGRIREAMEDKGIYVVRDFERRHGSCRWLSAAVREKRDFSVTRFHWLVSALEVDANWLLGLPNREADSLRKALGKLVDEYSIVAEEYDRLTGMTTYTERVRAWKKVAEFAGVE